MITTTILTLAVLALAITALVALIILGNSWHSTKA